VAAKALLDDPNTGMLFISFPINAAHTVQSFNKGMVGSTKPKVMVALGDTWPLGPDVSQAAEVEIRRRVASAYINEFIGAEKRGRFFLLYEVIFPTGLMFAAWPAISWYRFTDGGKFGVLPGGERAARGSFT
jgi:hypothetical protein